MGANVSAAEDPTIYPEEERAGEDIVQRWIVELLRPLLERWLAERGEPSFVGADQFIYYEQFNARRYVAPDVYVLPSPKTAWCSSPPRKRLSAKPVKSSAKRGTPSARPKMPLSLESRSSKPSFASAKADAPHPGATSRIVDRRPLSVIAPAA